MLLTVNLPVLAGIYDEIVAGNNESNIAYYCDEETKEEEKIDDGEIYSDEYEETYNNAEQETEENIKDEADLNKIIDSAIYAQERYGNEYIGIVPLNDIIVDGPSAGFSVAYGEVARIISGGHVVGDITLYYGSRLYIEEGARIEGAVMYGWDWNMWLPSGPVEVTMYGGEIYGSANAGVSIFGTFIMYGGEIHGNSGSGVHVLHEGSFTMYGGEIHGNSGGVVMSSGTFTMNGGEIGGNNSQQNGGGVYVIGGTFTMNGGEISGNNAAVKGGGVYVCHGGSFIMHGGEIINNTSVLTRWWSRHSWNFHNVRRRN
ncbi:MAG: hypothetical protein FWC79_08620 [Oscillospiraceae bacterium]|nr:hypothetical protein [Oscillospiraceae bacterium]